jgi:ribonuclease P protein component
MIAAAHRFHGHNSLRYVYQSGRTVRATHLGLKFAINPRRNSYRAAVVISKKVYKSAVARNSLRRRIYEQLRLQIPENMQAYDLVFTVFQPELNTLSPLELASSVAELLKKCGISRPTQPVTVAKKAAHGIVKGSSYESGATNSAN